MIYYIAMAAEQARANGGRWVTGQILADSKGGFDFEGFNQPLKAGRNGEGMQAPYVVLDYSGIGSTLYSTHTLQAMYTDGTTGSLKYIQSIHFAGSTPYTDSGCWFSPYFACAGGECTRYWYELLLCSLLDFVHANQFKSLLFLLFLKAWIR